ncbi:cell division control protein 48 homolog B [Impatiens glandulifera]|uniref:cell division control protein 48 homolog B n=1 Tax=Impatiens glandulifera TaxID=253017 RepID=UPI001FB07B2A|nr:cell division control protein 48 homolog B [Impatiens glandulifera]
MENNSSYKEMPRAEEAIAGNKEALQALRELIIYPHLYYREARELGHKWPRGLLLYGPPGTGKTSLVRAVVEECGAHLTVISPHTVHTAYAGEGERILREAFAEASSHTKLGIPSVIFFDEIDALCPRRDSRREQEVRLTSQLFMLMDSKKIASKSIPQVVVVASTNRVDAIDPALRRSGRFDAEIEVTTPNEEERFQILKLYTKKLTLDSRIDLRATAASCNGYVGADLEDLSREAAMSASRKSEETLLCSLTKEDWNHATSVVGPSITRGLTVEIPKVSWEDIGGLKDLKKKLQQAVEWPLKHSAAFSRLGVSPIRGILLHGPPGCSKTTLAKAAANAAQASFFSLSGAELYSMYVGEGEALLRNTFRRARLASPSIIFFDEADVVAAKRGGKSSSNIAVGERLLSTLLTEMDGLENANGILVLAATNRPHAIDAALMRPGRFDLVIYVPPPDLESRLEILTLHTRKMKLESDVDLRSIAKETEFFTGADLEGLCLEVGIVALREDISSTIVSNRHFKTVMMSRKPTLTREVVDASSSFMKKKNYSQKASGSTNWSVEQNKPSRSFSAYQTASSVFFGVASFGLLVGIQYFYKNITSSKNMMATT